MKNGQMRCRYISHFNKNHSQHLHDVKNQKESQALNSPFKTALSNSIFLSLFLFIYIITLHLIFLHHPRKPSFHKTSFHISLKTIIWYSSHHSGKTYLNPMLAVHQFGISSHFDLIQLVINLTNQNSNGVAVYRASRVIDALVNTERTNGASSPGCIVVGTIV